MHIKNGIYELSAAIESYIDRRDVNIDDLQSSMVLMRPALGREKISTRAFLWVIELSS